MLEFVKRYFARVGRSPSRRLVSACTGLSRRSVQAAVHGLVTEGALAVDPDTHAIGLPALADRLSEGDLLRVLVERGMLLDLSAALLHPALAGPRPCLHGATPDDDMPAVDGGSGDGAGGSGI